MFPRSSPVLPGPPRSSPVLPGPPRSSPVLPGPPRSSPVLPGPPRSSPVLPGPPRSSPVLPGPPRSSPVLPGPPRSSPVLGANDPGSHSHLAEKPAPDATAIPAPSTPAPFVRFKAETIPSRAEHHESLPHIVKFSGGRSSATLAILLAESGLLKPQRGDAILFANTSAEHPATYEFARKCKSELEGKFGIPFFWFEFCTVEDASRGAYARRASYRLVKPVPIEKDPAGYRSHGEVFEEMLSYQGMLPNPHQRSCTAKLKLYPSHQFLAEWLGRTRGPSHTGHHGDRRYLTPETALAQYRRNGGKASSQAYLKRVRYMTNQPPARPAQRWCDYTHADIPVRSGRPGPVSMWGPCAARHVTMLGLRADEPQRINKITARSIFAEGAGSRSCAIHTQPPGEYPCFPLADWGFDGGAVRQFWLRRSFDLDAPAHAGNCVFCFMKGTHALASAARRCSPPNVRAPSDISWWIEMENRYGRIEPSRDAPGTTRFGFFGVRGPTFAELADGAVAKNGRYATGSPACDCTD